MTAHAKLSASGAKKWLNCPGSVVMEAQFPHESSSYAQEGTNAHHLGEAKIRLAVKEYSNAKYQKAIKALEIDEEMAGYTDDYRDFVLERFNAARAKTPDAKLLLEQRLDFSTYVPEGFGTGDCVIVAAGFLEIIDLKYGAGVVVPVQDNPQLRLYALGAWEAWDYLYGIDEITMTIYQPRRDNISTETISAKELLSWGEAVKAKAALANSGTEDCFAGCHCDEGFCRARPVCRAYTDSCNRLAAMEFKRPNLLSLEEIAEVLELSSRLTKWAELVKAYALEQALQGHEVPGYKLVEGRSSRSFNTEDEVIITTLTNAGYNREDLIVSKLRTVADMEKFLGKKAFGELLNEMVTKPTGTPTLAPITDRRPEIHSAAAAQRDFAALKQEQV